MTDGFTDDDAAAFDVPAMLAEGVAGEDGRLRGELQGEAALGAAIQLERAGIHEDEVTLAVSQLHMRLMGTDVTLADFPAPLKGIVDAGVAATPREHERQLFLEWLALIPGLMRMRAGLR